MRRRKKTELQQVPDEVDKETGTGFVANDGDMLVVNCGGGKLQLAPYNTIELDSFIYTRRLQPGGDPEYERKLIHGWLRRVSQTEANQKIREWNEEFRKRRSGGQE
jgi:hypothetical protein